ncbi:MAG: ABC transporter permease [Acidobacteriota bacterium]|jgi:predicted permease
MSQLWQDLRYGWRMLGKHRSFTAVAVLSLAVGIGANTTIFSMVNGLLLRPLPVARPEQMTRIFTTFEGGDPFSHSTYPDLRDLRDGVGDAFSGVVGYFYFPVGLRGTDQAQVVLAQLVTANYFDVMGVRMEHGRGFLPSEERAEGADPVAVLSYTAWQRRFNGSADIVGRTVFVNNHPFTVVGVAPDGFTSPNVMMAPEVWVPVTMVQQVLPYPIDLDDRTSTWLLIAGRLRDGVGLERAQAALDIAMSNIVRAHPEDSEGKGLRVVAMNRARLGLKGTTDGTARIFALLMGVVGVVLLTACFNVANLHLARAASRQPEVALRLSLGASRGRILRQLLAESLILASIAGVVGLTAAAFAADALEEMVGAVPFPMGLDFSIDGRVLLFTLLLTLGTTVVFGLTPGLHMLRKSQFSALREQALSLSGGPGRTFMQRSLVVGQVALSMVLLVGAGLFLRSLQETLDIDPGFDAGNALVAPIDLGFGNYDEQQGRAFYERVVESVDAMPGVRSAALAAEVPLGQLNLHSYVEIDGYVPGPAEPMSFPSNIVGPGYFDTLEIPVIAGRAIDERDRAETRAVAMVNEAMERRFWPDQSALGQSIYAQGRWREIVGIIGDGKYEAIHEEPQPYVVVAMQQQEYIARFNLVVRTVADPEALMDPLRRELARLDPDLPIATIHTLREHLYTAFGEAFLSASVVGTLSVIALALAVVGIFGVTSYVVSRRRHEFGLRLAVGAGPRQILLLVLGTGLRMALAGVVIGLLVAVAATRLIAGFLYGVSPLEPRVYLLVALVLGAIALLACYLPARWAAHVDPVSALRVE